MLEVWKRSWQPHIEIRRDYFQHVASFGVSYCSVPNKDPSRAVYNSFFVYEGISKSRTILCFNKQRLCPQTLHPCSEGLVLSLYIETVMCVDVEKKMMFWRSFTWSASTTAACTMNFDILIERLTILIKMWNKTIFLSIILWCGGNFCHISLISIYWAWISISTFVFIAGNAIEDLVNIEVSTNGKDWTWKVLQCRREGKN